MRNLLTIIIAALMLGSTNITLAGQFEDSLTALKRNDYVKAMVNMRSLAAKKDARAQNEIGLMYQNGLGVAQDYAEALKWYRLAAAQENVLSQYNLGLMHENGSGVVQDYAEAIKWYRQAAAQGDGASQNKLGFMYANGLGVRRNTAAAYALYNLASNNGISIARINRDEVVSRANDTTRKVGEIISLEISKPGGLIKTLDNDCLILSDNPGNTRGAGGTGDFFTDLRRFSSTSNSSESALNCHW